MFLLPYKKNKNKNPHSMQAGKEETSLILGLPLV
jgi:hypothetical protein